MRAGRYLEASAVLLAVESLLRLLWDEKNVKNEMDGPLQRLLKAKPLLVLDGAMGTELKRRDVDSGLPLWSANALMVHPEIVLQIHTEYVEAGADIITTNTFRTTRRTLRRANLPDRSLQLTNSAVGLARQARESFPDRELLIAGSMAPLEDCYRPDLVPPDHELDEEHSELAGRLAKGGVDFIILETMNTIREAYAACRAARAVGKEAVVSFICDRRGCLLGGESLRDAITSVADLSPAAVSVNCVSPRHMSAALEEMKAAATVPWGVYGNVGVPESDKHGWEFTHDVLEKEYGSFAREWQKAGASIIGGCCGTTPAYTREIVRRCIPS